MKSIKSNVTKQFVMVASLFLVGAYGSSSVNASEVAEPISATVWVARTVEQVKQDISGNEYTIKWGDTLSVISEATNITIERLAQWNNISNIDLIFAGNKLVFSGNVVTLEDSNGNTISQAIIRDEDKINPEKPVGGEMNNSDDRNVSGDKDNSSTPSEDNDEDSDDTTTPTPPTDIDNDGGNGNEVTTPPAEGDNEQKKEREITETVVEENAIFTRLRVGPFLNTTESSAWMKVNYPDVVKGYEVHPDGDYIYIVFGVANPDQITPPEDGDNESSGGDNGSGEDNGSGGEETGAITPVNLGNSGIFKSTVSEANAVAYALWAEGKFVEFTHFVVYPALNANGEIIGYTVNFD
ncbi:LysM peptidoglycan-binding domain-containing protein [Enterococcus sp. DIV0876]|uniref:LysM peptidoglycan-binding domain-containing protein n=1 Tax=Enterococcus sp. DIV0876 TaxID=2774633 RepID=UPI003D2FE95C